MYFNIKKSILLKWIIKDEFNHEFHPLMMEIKKKLNLKVNTVSLFFILLVYQYAFIFLLLILMFGIRTSNLFMFALGVISVFNLFLPRTIARTSVQRIGENPVYECLVMSDLSLNQSKWIMIFSELGNFWIHNFSFELLSICLFIIKFRGIGIIYSIIWVVIVSFIFLKVLIKKADIHHSIVYSHSLRTYIFNLIVVGVIAYNIFDIFVRTLSKISMSEFFEPRGLSKYARDYVSRIINVFKEKSFYLLMTALALFILYMLIRLWVQKIHLLKIEVLKDSILKKYIAFISKITKSTFVNRDIKLIFNILSKLEINVFTIVFPSGIIFMLVAYVFLVLNSSNQYATILSLDFIFWTVIYQFASFLVQKIPIFNISSELYNIELIIMSNSTMRLLIKSKHKLLAIFCSPLLVLILIEKISLIFMNCNPLIILLSLVINIGIFAICIILVLKWTLILPNFDWDNIFMLKQDNFDSQILQQFLLVPGRIVTLYFSISFVLANIVSINYEISFMLLYYSLTLIGIIIMYILLSRRNKNEITI